MDEEYYITAGDESTLIKPLTPSVKVAPLSKPDELWEKYVGNGVMITRDDFLAALKEYGEHFRAEAVSVCLSESTCEGIAQRCAAAIEKMELP